MEIMTPALATDAVGGLTPRRMDPLPRPGPTRAGVLVAQAPRELDRHVAQRRDHLGGVGLPGSLVDVPESEISPQAPQELLLRLRRKQLRLVHGSVGTDIIALYQRRPRRPVLPSETPAPPLSLEQLHRHIPAALKTGEGRIVVTGGRAQQEHEPIWRNPLPSRISAASLVHLASPMKPASLLVLIGLAASCAGPGPSVATVPLASLADSAEYAPFRGTGSLDLTGHAFLTTRSGEVKHAAGRLVTLDPATRYARQWFRRYGTDAARFDLPAPDPRFVAARRTTTADADGRFTFSRLPPGTYLVRSAVTWEMETADSGVQGGVVAALVTLEDGDSADLVLGHRMTPDSATVLVVPVLSDSALASRRHRLVAHLTAAACDDGPSGEVPDQRAARAELVLNAARKGADAVGRVACRKRGLSLAMNCRSRIECQGDAILLH
jgi:hypothetical protein